MAGGVRLLERSLHSFNTSRVVTLTAAMHQRAVQRTRYWMGNSTYNDIGTILVLNFTVHLFGSVLNERLFLSVYLTNAARVSGGVCSCILMVQSAVTNGGVERECNLFYFCYSLCVQVIILVARRGYDGFHKYHSCTEFSAIIFKTLES